jgi:hypothetical protein
LLQRLTRLQGLPDKSSSNLMHDCFFRFSFILAWPVDLLANYTHLSGLLIELGPDLKMPHSKALGKGLFELRLKQHQRSEERFIVSYRAKR